MKTNLVGASFLEADFGTDPMLLKTARRNGGFVMELVVPAGSTCAGDMALALNSTVAPTRSFRLANARRKVGRSIRGTIAFDVYGLGTVFKLPDDVRIDQKVVGFPVVFRETPSEENRN
jgi:hypothetical protein